MFSNTFHRFCLDGAVFRSFVCTFSKIRSFCYWFRCLQSNFKFIYEITLGKLNFHHSEFLFCEDIHQTLWINKWSNIRERRTVLKISWYWISISVKVQIIPTRSLQNSLINVIALFSIYATRFAISIYNPHEIIHRKFPPKMVNRRKEHSWPASEHSLRISEHAHQSITNVCFCMCWNVSGSGPNISNHCANWKYHENE